MIYTYSDPNFGRHHTTAKAPVRVPNLAKLTAIHGALATTSLPWYEPRGAILLRAAQNGGRSGIIHLILLEKSTPPKNNKEGDGSTADKP